MKIVVAVDMDKKTIFKRTGQAVYFAIYEDDKVVNFIKNNHNENEEDKQIHSEHILGHKKSIMGLQGCDIFLVQAVGEHFQEALDSIGLKVKKIRKKDGITADEVVKNFLNNNPDF